MVLETGGQRFLLGVTEANVNVLHTSDAEPAPDAGFAASLQDAAAANGGSQAGTDDGGLPPPPRYAPHCFGQRNLRAQRLRFFPRIPGGRAPRSSAADGPANGGCSIPCFRVPVSAGAAPRPGLTAVSAVRACWSLPQRSLLMLAGTAPATPPPSTRRRRLTQRHPRSRGTRRNRRFLAWTSTAWTEHPPPPSSRSSASPCSRWHRRCC